MSSSSQEFALCFDDNFKGLERKLSARPFLKPKRKRMSEDQTRTLMNAFSHTPKPSATLRMKLAVELGLTARAVQIWFQNRRARQKAISVGGVIRPSNTPDNDSNDLDMSSACLASGSTLMPNNAYYHHPQPYGLHGEEDYEDGLVGNRQLQDNQTTPCSARSSVSPYGGSKGYLNCNTQFDQHLFASGAAHAHTNQQPALSLNCDVRNSTFPLKDLLLTSVQDSALDLSADSAQHRERFAKFETFDPRGVLSSPDSDCLSSNPHSYQPQYHEAQYNHDMSSNPLKLAPLIGNMTNGNHTVLPSFDCLRQYQPTEQGLENPESLIHEAEEDTHCSANLLDWSDIVWSSLENDFGNPLSLLNQPSQNL